MSGSPSLEVVGSADDPNATLRDKQPSRFSLSQNADLLRNAGTAVVIVLLWLALSIASPVFFTSENITSVFLEWSTLAILSIGLTVVLIGGEMDLSIGSVQAFAGIIAAQLMIVMHVAVPIGIVVAIAAALIIGVLNAGVSRLVAAPTFVVTLAALGIVHGATLLISNSRSISLFPASFSWLGQGKVVGVPVPVIIALCATALVHVLLHQSAFGTAVFAIGGNRAAAMRCGINVTKVVIGALVLSAVMATIAGLVTSARVDAANADLGVEQLLNAIAAIVIGGTSLLGGKGSVVGTALGALVVSTIRNGLVLLGVAVWAQPVILGALTLAAVMVDQIVRGEVRPALPRRRRVQASAGASPGR